MELNQVGERWQIVVEDNDEFEEVVNALFSSSPAAYIRLNTSFINSGFPAQAVVSEKQLFRLSDRLSNFARRPSLLEWLGLVDRDESSTEICERLSGKILNTLSVL